MAPCLAPPKTPANLGLDKDRTVRAIKASSNYGKCPNATWDLTAL